MKKPITHSETTISRTGVPSITERLQQLADVEQRRIESERQSPEPSPPSSPVSDDSQSQAEPSHRQLVDAVALLRDFCRDLERQSVYLSARITHAISSAEAEFVVGIVDHEKFWDPQPEWGTVNVHKTVRIGNVREDYQHTMGVAEIVETGEVLRDVADLRAYLDNQLLPEIGEAIGRCRADHESHFPDEPSAREELPLNLAIIQCVRLIGGIIELLQAEEGNFLGPRERLVAARSARSALATVGDRLGKLYSYYGLEDEWPSVLLEANLAWLTPTAQAFRVRDLIHAAQVEVLQYAEEHRAAATEHERELQEAEANADRLADEAFYDVRLEKRLESDLEESAEEYYHYHGRASAAEEVAAVLTECLNAVDAVMSDVVVALAARRGTSIAAQDASRHQEWNIND